jgi:hypothetical protein
MKISKKTFCYFIRLVTWRDSDGQSTLVSVLLALLAVLEPIQFKFVKIVFLTNSSTLAL